MKKNEKNENILIFYTSCILKSSNHHFEKIIWSILFLFLKQFNKNNVKNLPMFTLIIHNKRYLK
jgi:hypothetical protein